MTAEARTPKRRRYWKWMVGLALILCLTVGVAWHSRKRSLLEQSTKVADVKGWWISPYHWVSDHQILFSRWGGEKEGLYIYDTRSQNETFLRSLTHLMQKREFVESLDALYLSPDSTRLIWSLDGEEPVYGACLDGSHYFTCVPRRYPGSASWTQVRWSNDSHHWVAFVMDRQGATEAMLYEKDASQSKKTVPTVASEQSDLLEAMGMISTQSLISDNHLLTCQWNGNQNVTPAVDIVDIGIGVPAAGLKTHHLSLPSNTTIQEVVIAPQGDRVAFHLSMQAVPEWVRLLQRWVPQIHVHGPLVESLWVSRIDGTDMREIGSRNLEAKEKFTPQLTGLQWVPGSKRVSFRYGWTLYTVPAE